MSLQDNIVTNDDLAEGAQWLNDKINRMIDVPYTVEKQITHIRPTCRLNRTTKAHIIDLPSELRFPCRFLLSWNYKRNQNKVNR